jgi:HSP20 family molecular chaperone IbpA
MADDAARTLPANVYEGNGQLSVSVPIPGAHHDHVSVTLSAERLRIDAQSKYPQQSQNYLRHDWHVGRWELDLNLPKPVAAERAHATLNLGVLTVMAPVAASGGATQHRIPVEVPNEARKG